MTEPSYEHAVLSWAAHLRDGGTTPWSGWSGSSATPLPAPDRPLPDAVHFELVRRLNLAGAGDPALDDPGLADRVLATPAPGRGRLDVPLPWAGPGGPGGRFGTPPVDPERLPAEELVRLAVGVLARLVPGVPPGRAEPAPGRWPLPWRRRFRLHGSPGTVAGIRAALVDQGFVESDWRPTHVVVARPVEVMMAEQWAAAVRAGAILKWSTYWRRAVQADRLPGAVDVARLADGLEGRRHEPVHVVVARDAAHASALALDVLGARETVAAETADLPRSDLLRRFNRVVPLTSGPDRVRPLAATLLDRVLDPAPTGTTPLPPAPARAWATEVATTTAAHLREAGYPVHGVPEELVTAYDARLTGFVDTDLTLGLALSACHRAWQLQEGPR